MVARLIGKLIAPLARRVRLMARRAVVRLIDDSQKLQEAQLAIFSGEVRDLVERFQEYGFTSHPHAGAEAIVLALGGNTDHGAIIAVDDRRYRLTGLAAGEVAIYDDQGQVIHLKRDGHIHIYGCNQLTVTAAEKITFDAPLVECTGDLLVGEDISATGEIADAAGVKKMSGMRQVFDSHTHPGDSGGTTGTPNQGM